MDSDPKQSNSKFVAFTNLVDDLLSVPHSEIKRRMEEYKKNGPHKRGPKPRTKRMRSITSAFHDPAAKS